MIKNYHHIIWDWNGTLLNDVSICSEIINCILTKRNLKPISMTDYKNIFTFPVKEYYEKAGLDFSAYSFEELGLEWITKYESLKFETKLFPDAEVVLNYIRDMGISQSILSAYSHHTLLEIVKHFGVEKYFLYLFGLDNIYAASKIDLGKKLMEKLQVDFKNILLIGDTIHDFDVAKEIGADCILISNGHQSKDRLLTCNVPVLDSLKDLVKKWD